MYPLTNIKKKIVIPLKIYYSYPPGDLEQTDVSKLIPVSSPPNQVRIAMKSIPKMAKALDLSSTTIREYINRFNEFFADPVAHKGIKEFPDETQELLARIHTYYTETEMTKEQIRVKLGGEESAMMEDLAPQKAVAVSPVDTEQFKILGDKIDRLTDVIEALTQALVNAGGLGFSNVRKAYAGDQKLNQITDQITDIIEISKGGTESNFEKNVLDADGTIIFSFGKLSANAVETLHLAKAHNKPWIHIDLETEKNPGPSLRKWIDQFDIKILNVAGRRAAKVPGLKRSVNEILSVLLKE